MVSKYFDKYNTEGNMTPKRLFEKLEGPFDWNGAISEKLADEAGVYVINAKGWDWKLDYPYGKSDIIYIGESEDIGRRLNEHKSYGRNHGLAGYANRLRLNIYFRKVYHISDLKKNEAYMIKHFENMYGRAPICNGQTPNID
ncbi:MAG: hypothetical protein K8R11_10130 [Methanococcoides sp.]|nr:hypothetical protein [Methanococcoides sp.]